MSHETEADFVWFYQSIIKICSELGIRFQINILMADACDAHYNAVKKILPQTKLLMCYFHVKQNVQKHSKLIKDDDELTKVNNEVSDMHSSRTFDELCMKWQTISARWMSEEVGMQAFAHYFYKQWLTERYNSWQAFCVPAGLALTNSPIESYNAKIKKYYI